MNLKKYPGLSHVILVSLAIVITIAALSVLPIGEKYVYVERYNWGYRWEVAEIQENKAYVSTDYILGKWGQDRNIGLPNIEYIVMSENEHNSISWASARELLEMSGYELILLDHTGVNGYYIGTFHRKG